MKLQILVSTFFLMFGLSAHALSADLLMYKTAPGVATSDCETVVELQARTITGRSGARVIFINTANTIVGECEKHAEPDLRTYMVTAVEESCGSKIYQAEDTRDPQEKLTLIDHRVRLCKDIVPALFVLERVHPVKLYRPMYNSAKP